MKKYRSPFATALAFALGVITANAGTIFYQAIPANDSDAGSGISSDNQYTSAVDGGNTRGPDRVINGITLYALAADGESATADNCTVNALAGNLSNGGGGGSSIQADGIFKDALSDMTFNNGATDNSQQEIVLDPESLEEGTTYDLRVYVCNSSGQNRQVSLSFVGDGQPAVETGFFNEDDARTSPGGFKDASQTYYINYRFTWDGDSTPGITITQKSGSAPFVLYALTNQVVPGGSAAPEPAAVGPGRPRGPRKGVAQAGGGGQGGPAMGQGGQGQGEGEGEGEGGDEGLSSGWVDQGDDEVGIGDDSFYGSDSLNSNGNWVDVDQWGKAWQPTNVQEGWAPYTNGTFQNCDECGWTFVSEEPWAWACYHYGRWCKVSHGCGWAWVPGKVWAGSWVSWREGRGEGCDCLGWAPLPPEAGCRWGVGISSWVDSSCNIGPDCYTFINIRDFGRDSYSGCGCIWDRGRNSTVIIDTWNTTNICHTKWGTYCGGPDFKKCNERIRQHGGKECGNVHVNRYDNPGKMGGKYSKHEGNQLGLLSPHVKGNAQHTPKTAANIGKDKIDHGWNNVKDPKAKQQVQNHLAQEAKGKNAKNSPAKLPNDVAQKMQKHGGRNLGQQGAQGGGNLHPGGKGAHKGAGAQAQAGGGQGANRGFNQHPGGKGKQFGQGQGGNAAAAGGGGQHPGHKNKGQAAAGVAGGGQGGQMAGAGGGGGGKGMHPGQKRSQRGQAGMGQAGAGGAQGGAGGGGQHPGKRGGKGGQQFGQGGNQAGGPGAAGGQAGAGGGRGKGGKNKQQQAQQAQQPAGQQGGFGGAGGGGQKHRKQQQAQQAQQPGGQQGGFGGAGGGGQKHRKQQQAQQFQQPAGQQGGGGGQKRHMQQQQMQQRQGQGVGHAQPGGQQQQRQGGKKGRKPTPAPR